jgi:hypothetical protein
MKTQINILLSGTKNQVLNPAVNYDQFPQATSHVGHGGSNAETCSIIWNEVTNENPDKMTIKVKGEIIELAAHWSGSRKSVSYTGEITKEFLESAFFIKAAKDKTPYISIQGGNIIMVGNGKKSWRYVCPTLFEIL